MAKRNILNFWYFAEFGQSFVVKFLLFRRLEPKLLCI